jgi:hypothetical protein
MNAALHTVREGERPRRQRTTAHCPEEVQLRLERVLAQLHQARVQWRRAQQAAAAAEEAFLARKLEREAAALRVAELADLAESLEALCSVRAITPQSPASPMRAPVH